VKINRDDSRLSDEAPPASESLDTAPLSGGVTQIDLSKYTRIPLTKSQVEVSSTLRPTLGKQNLVEAEYRGFWHVTTPKDETRPWISIDMKTPQPVAALGILDRQDTDQLWHGYRATLEGSNDNNSWEIIAWLGLPDNRPRGQWTYFFFPNPKDYQYYRFSSHDWNFMSMTKLNMYALEGTLAPVLTSPPVALQIEGTNVFDITSYEKIPLESSQLEVSSFSEPWDKTKLVHPDIAEFWHVDNTRQEQAWVLVDLREKQAVTMLRVRPREGLASQLWNGYTAYFEASDDGLNWTKLATLGIMASELTGDWIHFLVGNLDPYRYYRLSINDRYFFSISKLELYRITQ
jgi:hypothetical protein